MNTPTSTDPDVVHGEEGSSNVLALTRDDVVLPSVLPEYSETVGVLKAALRDCLTRNLLSDINASLDNSIGCAGLFDDAIIYKEVGVGLNGLRELFSGKGPIQQFVGRILCDGTIMSIATGDYNNCIAGSRSMANTFIRVADDTFIVKHRMNVTPLLNRYLHHVGWSDMVSTDLDYVYFQIPVEPNMQSVKFLADNLDRILTVYYRILTRFHSCQTYSNTLPTFENS